MTDGFYWGDRTSLDLPRAQEQLLEAVAATGKPTVLLLLNGGPITTAWASAHAGAIVEAWYPGEEGGTAIADVLFGDYNPGGRLPVTIYKSVDQLPPFGGVQDGGQNLPLLFRRAALPIWLRAELHAFPISRACR